MTAEASTADARAATSRSGWGSVVRLESLGGTVELGPGGAHPVIDRGTARISEEALNRLLMPLPLPLTLRLNAGEAAVEAEVGGFRISATVHARAGHTGKLRVEATSLRLGWLPVPPHLLALALGRLEGRRGITVDGQRSLELDLPELLSAIPVALDVRVSHVRLEPGWLELHCVPRSGR
jgi:hypothetical protein